MGNVLKEGFISRVYDASLNMQSGLLLLAIVWLFYPYYSVVVVWAGALGACFAVHQVVPYVMVTKYLVTSNTILLKKLGGRYMGYLSFFNSLALYVAVDVMVLVYEGLYPSYALMFMICGFTLFLVNFASRRKLQGKEEEVFLMRFGLAESLGEPLD